MPTANLIKRVLTLLALVVPVAACASSADSPAPSAPSVNADAVEVVRGVPDRGRDPAVVAIDIASEGLCSGALIADNAVLTARHCVAKTAERIGCPSRDVQVLEDRQPSSLRVFAGEQLPNLQFVATGRKIVVPAGLSLCDGDIAVLLLDRRVTGIEPLAVSDRGVAQGDHVRAVGFGRRGDSASAGVKLLRDHVPVVGTSSAEFLVGEATCSGDSGGPAIDEESGRIVGVVSRGGPACEGKGVHNVYTRADAFLELISAALGREDGGGGGPSSAADAGSGGSAPRRPDAGASGAVKKPPTTAKKPPSDVGGACERADECAAGVCITDHERRYCSRRCGVGDRCPVHYHCTKLEGAEAACIER